MRKYFNSPVISAHIEGYYVTISCLVAFDVEWVNTK